jgi:hypothetical protein
MHEVAGQNTLMTEDEALAYLAMLMSSARGLINEPADYGPMRLVVAMHHLVRILLPRAEGSTRELLTRLEEAVACHLPKRRAEPDRWVQFIEDANRWIAREMMQRGLSR